MAETKRQTLGRRRTECKIIEDKAAREVTFSKRHRGMFWKASELAVLCGAEVAIIAYSPHGNPFVFGHPSADAVIDRYISGGGGARASEAATSAATQAIDKRKKQYQDAASKLKEVKGDAVEAGGRRAAGNLFGGMWWDGDVDDGMGVEELEHYVASLENMMKKVADKINTKVCI
ncbi:agamous-like MADS-box protein AGL61 [Rhodamnia argentea]|uniref:Agamous-like MADS-box protein AGL61 n=1 Tax=Rhodamnia argentea TaxID=178133 RepID=A0A8B8MZK5_9MYRT|nr:agamous-like MADS-box protein AGL61 [Rhodamnia argentea]